jgi:REP element-mobilizing transposase RayT
MSLPRQIVPGRVYLLTRRCSERRFLMRPDAATSNAFVYCLAVSAQRFGVEVLAFGTMANHHHIVAVDRDGRLPDFLQYFHRLFAAHQNVLRGRWESFWAASEQASAVELVGPEDILEKMVYAILNPVKDNIVDQLHHWPGPNAFAAILEGTSLVATRPARFFRRDGPLPEAARLSLTRPPGFEHMSAADFSALLRRRVLDAQEKARADRLARGVRVLGRKAVLAQHWNDRPRSQEPRRRISPRVACRSRWARIEALQRNKAWHSAYVEARAAWLAGDREAVFPAGVWQLCRHAGVRCAPHPPPS